MERNDDWGTRALAYEIDHQREAEDTTSDPSSPARPS